MHPTFLLSYSCSHKCVNSSFTDAIKVYLYTYSKNIFFHAPSLFTHIYTKADKIILDTQYVNTNSNILSKRM